MQVNGQVANIVKILRSCQESASKYLVRGYNNIIFAINLNGLLNSSKINNKRKMKRLLVTVALALASLTITQNSDACSNVLVTPGASKDGSSLVSYSADSHALYGELYYRPAAVWEKGSLLKIYEWDTGKYLGEIPQVAKTYQTVGNMNEYQLVITETTYGGRPELFDPDGIMDYGSLIYVALQRAKTAREAIDVIVDLANTYGYYSSGESFSISDPNEVWIMELIGKGPDNKGIVWVARRVPDGYISAHANQARIDRFPLNDPDNCLYAPDVISFAREKGYFDGEDSEFSFCETYAPYNFSALRGCEARVWSAFNILTDGQFTFVGENGEEVTKAADEYLDFAMGYNPKNKMPLFVKPSRKITVKDVADVMRDHYEGTPMDMTQDIGAGGNALPYRWRPMTFEYEGQEYTNERAIATQQTGFWMVGQSRGWLPDVVGGILWFGTDDAATSYLTPIYTSLLEVPECFREGNGSMLEYSPTSAFWMTNRVANACYRMYDVMASDVRARIDRFENETMAEIASVDAKAMELYETYKKTGFKRYGAGKAEKAALPFEEVRRYLTEYSVGTAQDIFSQWCELEVYLLLKYMDGNVKGQNPDGSWIDNGYDKGVPGDITNPGYTEKWKESVVREHGDVIRVVEPE